MVLTPRRVASAVMEIAVSGGEKSGAQTAESIILDQLRKLGEAVQRIETKIDKLEQDVENLRQDVDKMREEQKRLRKIDQG